MNNISFATPPDGQSGIMQMYLFTLSTPKRDGSLDNGIPIHEYMHGVSNRLTGGAAQGNCLRTNIAGGMGEGWSDAMAIYLTMKSGMSRDTDVVVGEYVVLKPNGIRTKPYSTSLDRNPYTFGILQQLKEVHAIGTYWATVLYEVYWNLVDFYGFSDDLYKSSQKKGNIMAIQLMIGGLKLQPCNPTMLSARDAILAADIVYYGGDNKCLLWRAFSKRGLGIDAVENGFVDGFKMPVEC